MKREDQSFGERHTLVLSDNAVLADSIVDSYRRPPVTFEDVYKVVRESQVNPLEEFTEASREELKSMLKSL